MCVYVGSPGYQEASELMDIAGNRYLVSSKHFTPSAFLRDVHATTPSPVLQKGLTHLSQSIAQKSGSLKVLVETNFDRFVAAKATIEGVYKEMKENAFLSKEKESEFSVGKIRGYLNEAGTKADDIFGPIMTGRGREESLRFLMNILDKHGHMLDIPGVLLDAVKRKDHETLLEEYQKARKYVDDSRALVPNPSRGFGLGVKEEHIHQLVLTERMWVEVEIIIDDFKTDTWKRLLDCKTEDNAHMELIGILLEIGVENNPITMWLTSRYDYLKDRIATVFERTRMEIEGLLSTVGVHYSAANFGQLSVGKWGQHHRRNHKLLPITSEHRRSATWEMRPRRSIRPSSTLTGRSSACHSHCF